MSLVMPFLVILVEQSGGNGVIYGIMAAVYPAFQLVGSPILGRWSDRLGRKPVLLLSQAGTTLAWVLFYLALLPRAVPLLRVQSGAFGSFAITIPLLLLFAARALDGVTGGNVSVANAYLSDISTPSTRSKNFGLLALSSNLGFIVGPTLAGLLGASALGVRLPVIAAFGISLIGLLLIGALLQEQPRRRGGPAGPGGSERDTPGVPDSPRQPRVHYCPQAGTTTLDDVEVVEGVAEPCESERGFSAILRIPNVSRFLMLYFVLFLGFNIFYAVFPVHALRVYEWSSAELGIFFSTLSVLMVVVQGPLMGFLSGRVGEVPLVVGGSGILAISFVVLIFGGPLLAFLAAALFALGNGVMWPSFLSLLASLVSEDLQGEVQGFGASAGSAASIIGLVAGGVLYEAIGSTTFALSAVAFLTAVIASLIMPSSPGTATPLRRALGSNHAVAKRSGQKNLG
jgi:MFS family permease